MKRIITTITLSFLFVGCNTKEIERLEYELYEVNNELEEANEKISSLEDYTYELGHEIDNLKEEVEDFDWEDWRYNVSDVKEKMRDVESAFDNLQYEF